MRFILQEANFYKSLKITTTSPQSGSPNPQNNVLKSKLCTCLAAEWQMSFLYKVTISPVILLCIKDLCPNYTCLGSDVLSVMYLTFCDFFTDFPNVIAKHQIFGECTPPGMEAMIPNSNSAEICVQCTYPQVSSSCVYSFVSYRIDKQTHKPTQQTNRFC